MTELKQLYKCNICGNIVEVLHKGMGKLVCCGQEMELLKEKKSDEGQEKHKPIIKKTNTGFKIKVGSIEHPMEEEHYIEFIEAISNGKVYRKQLKPGDKPEVEFCIEADNIKARIYCNLHGVWQT